MTLDIEWIRNQFPGLSQELNGQPIACLDGPGGTQIVSSALNRMRDYLLHSNANAHGAFVTSARTDATIAAAREAMADFLGCDSDEVVFGANMTSLTFSVSRAIGRDLQVGDEIVVTRLDHDANVAPWMALQETGAVVRMVDIDPADCTLDMADLERQLSDRTRLIAVGYASNATGTINDIAAIVRLARRVGAWVFVDAVHYAPPRLHRCAGDRLRLSRLFCLQVFWPPRWHSVRQAGASGEIAALQSSTGGRYSALPLGNRHAQFRRSGWSGGDD